MSQNVSIDQNLLIKSKNTYSFPIIGFFGTTTFFIGATNVFCDVTIPQYSH